MSMSEQPSSTPQARPEDSDAEASGEPENTEVYIEAYHAIAEWIRFADAKAGVVLTVEAALAGLLIPTIKHVLDTPEGETLHLLPMWKTVVLSLFGLFIFFLLLSGSFAFRCIAPFRLRGRHPAIDHCHHFHPAAVATHYQIGQVDRYTADCVREGVPGFRRQVLAAILLDSHISNVKYRFVVRSIQLFAVSSFFAFLYLLTMQL